MEEEMAAQKEQDEMTSEEKQEFRFEQSEDLEANDYEVEFPTEDDFTETDNKIWRKLYNRQMDILKGRAADEFFENHEKLQLESDKLPRYTELNDYLKDLSGWEIVPVPGLIPAKYFFKHLANKRFPTTNWIRSPEEMDYIKEPDCFHDIFGHIPMLADPTFADYTQQYGEEAQYCLELNEEYEHDILANLTRTYWYTVEFGLIQQDDGLRIYGAGIQSSKTESIYSLESPEPRRIKWDLERAMRTDYDYSDLQTNYFVIDSYEQLLKSTRPEKLREMYEVILEDPYEYSPTDKLDSDVLVPPNESDEY